MSLKFNIDITPFIAEAFATNKTLRSDISRLYLKNKYEAYKAAHQSSHYDNKLFSEGNVKRDEMCKKALGLIEMNESATNEELIKLVQKGWTKLFSLMKKYENDNLEVEDVLLKFPIDEMNDDAMNAMVSVMMFLVDHMACNVLDSPLHRVINNTIIQRFLNLSNDAQYSEIKKNKV